MNKEDECIQRLVEKYLNNEPLHIAYKRATMSRIIWRDIAAHYHPYHFGRRIIEGL